MYFVISLSLNTIQFYNLGGRFIFPQLHTSTKSIHWYRIFVFNIYQFKKFHNLRIVAKKWSWNWRPFLVCNYYCTILFHFELQITATVFHFWTSLLVPSRANSLTRITQGLSNRHSLSNSQKPSINLLFKFLVTWPI